MPKVLKWEWRLAADYFGCKIFKYNKLRLALSKEYLP
jgi:hypothetical protein